MLRSWPSRHRNPAKIRRLPRQAHARPDGPGVIFQTNQPHRLDEHGSRRRRSLLGRIPMRGYVLATVAAVALLTSTASSFAQGVNCEELRLACELKNQLGERGEGN